MNITLGTLAGFGFWFVARCAAGTRAAAKQRTLESR
jgi:hypothetical protein